MTTNLLRRFLQESWKLSDADIKIFTGIIDREIMKESLVKKTPAEQMKIVDVRPLTYDPLLEIDVDFS